MFGFPTEYKLPAGSDAQCDDFFGGSVGISGDLAVVGALGQLGYNDGKVYIYKRGASGWVEQAKLTQLENSGGIAFARAVSITGSDAVVGVTRPR
jgi:hypothetical protein